MLTVLEEKQMFSHILRDPTLHTMSVGYCKPLRELFVARGLSNLQHLTVCTMTKAKGHLPALKFLKRSPGAQRDASVAQKASQWGALQTVPAADHILMDGPSPTLGWFHRGSVQGAAGGATGVGQQWAARATSHPTSGVLPPVPLQAQRFPLLPALRGAEAARCQSGQAMVWGHSAPGAQEGICYQQCQVAQLRESRKLTYIKCDTCPRPYTTCLVSNVSSNMDKTIVIALFTDEKSDVQRPPVSWLCSHSK